MDWSYTKINFHYQNTSQGFITHFEAPSTSYSCAWSNEGAPSRPRPRISSNCDTTRKTIELKPKRRINWDHKMSKTNDTDTMESASSRADDEVSRLSMDYDDIKPMLGISKYFSFCGFEKGEGIQGCTCSWQPCRWSEEWTKSYMPKNRVLYNNLKKQKPNPVIMEQIEKDLPRTYSKCPTFSINQSYRKMLRGVLQLYSVYDPEAQYVQGMNMVAAVLLYHIKDEERAFWAFADLMDEKQLRMIYLTGFAALKKHCQVISRLVESKINDLHQAMLQLEIQLEVFLYGWLLSLMSNCVPLEYMHLVIDKFRLEGWGFMYQLITTYLIFLKEGLLLASDCSEFLMQVNNASGKEHGFHWEEIIANCHKVKLDIF